MPTPQKTSIICDFREGADQRRFFWPCEIWGSAEYTADGRTPSADILELPGDQPRAAWDHQRVLARVRRARPPPQKFAHRQLCRYRPRDARRSLLQEPRCVRAEFKNLQSQSGRGRAHSQSTRTLYPRKASPADPDPLRVTAPRAKLEHRAQLPPSSTSRPPSMESAPASASTSPTPARALRTQTRRLADARRTRSAVSRAGGARQTENTLCN